MVIKDCTVTVSNNTAKIDEEIYLYKNDKNIELTLNIVNSKYKYTYSELDNLIASTKAAYAQVKFKNGDIEIDFDIQETKSGAVKLLISEELIDEDTELGDYSIQIRLFDSDRNSVITLPPIENCIHIKRPLFDNSNVVFDNSNMINEAKINLATLTTEAPLEVTDSNGNYVKTVWKDKDKITDAKMNKIESGIYQNSAQLNNIANQIANGNIGNNVEPALMDMPRLYFSEGTLPTSKTSTTMKFDYYSKTKEEHGYVDIKCQGNSSMAYNKKNFTIKLYKDESLTEKLKIDFKGWGKQSKFVLKANWIDLTHARNVVSARLWADVVKSRTDYSSLPELLKTSPNQGAVDGFPVLVYSNGVYQGRYTLNIPKDKWMSNMDDTLDTHCILCGENYASGCFRATANINGSDWTDELHDTVPNSIKTRWNECISFVMNSTDEEFKANLSNYFDVESIIDYLLFGIISCGLDAFGKNQLYFTYDGQKWIASMYDMDSTWGLWWNGSKFVATDYPRESFEDYNGSGREGNLLYIRLQKLFVDEIKARYTELRKDILSASHIIQRFEEFIQICPNDVVKEDYASTTGEGKFTGIPSTSTNNIQQIRNYAVARLTYVDSYIDSLVEAIACTGITLNANAIVFESTTATQTLVATVEPSNTTDSVVWSVDDSTIATVENGVVTPLKNGSCVVTATCGNYSATCTVTVSGISESTTTNYSITNNLTNCTNSNSATTVEENASYSATLTASDGYTLNNITVTMGGTDITSTVVSNEVITIDSVTGDIIITANATSTSSEDNLVFQVDGTCLDTESNTLTDKKSGIIATLTGTPTLSNNNIAFDDNSAFSFDLSLLNLKNSSRTLRVKFKPTTLDTNARCIFNLGLMDNNTQYYSWQNSTSSYVLASSLKIQHGHKSFQNVSVGNTNDSINRLQDYPNINQEYEIVISEDISSNNVRWFIDGVLIQNGTTEFFSPLYLYNTEGNHRFIGEYSLIEIYNEFVDTYEDFQNMIAQ